MSSKLYLDQIYSKSGLTKIIDTSSFDSNNFFESSNTGFKVNYQSSNAALEVIQSGTGNAMTVNTDKFVIDTTGKIGIGTNNLNISNKDTTDPALIVNGSGVNGSVQIVRNTSVGNGGALLNLSSTRGAGPTDYTILQDNDGIGTLSFKGTDGNEFVVAANIQANIDGTPSDDSMPGRITFSTTPSGSTSPTERMRIDSNGVLTAKAKPVGLFDIGECIYSETVSWVSNTSLSHNIGLTYGQISGGGQIYKFTFLGAMQNLTDGISYTSLYAVYRNDYIGLLSFVESQNSARHSPTAGAQYNFGVTNPGASNGGSNISVFGTLLGGGNAGYQASVLILVHQINTNTNYLT